MQIYPLHFGHLTRKWTKINYMLLANIDTKYNMFCEQTFFTSDVLVTCLAQQVSAKIVLSDFKT